MKSSTKIDLIFSNQVPIAIQIGAPPLTTDSRQYFHEINLPT